MKFLKFSFVFLMILLVSCSKDDADPVVPEKSVREKLYGKWKLTDLVISGRIITDDNNLNCTFMETLDFSDYYNKVLNSYMSGSGCSGNSIIYEFFANEDDLYFRLPNSSGPESKRYKIIELTDTTLKLEEYYVKTLTSNNDFSTWKRVN